MAIHKVNVYENTSELTREDAPFLGRYVSNGTAVLDDIVRNACEEAGLKSIQMRAILEGVFAAISKYNEQEGATRFHLPGGLSTCVQISGSLASSDAALSSENAVVQSVRIDSELRNLLVNEVPTLIGGEDVVTVRFDRVFDLEKQKPQGIILGKHVARAQGLNLVMTDEGARVYLTDRRGVIYPCTIDSVISSQEFTFHSDTLLAAGDYYVVIETRGGNAEGGLQSVKKPVKYLHVVDPTRITAIKDEDGNDHPTYGKGGEIDGELLPTSFTDGDKVTLYENGAVCGSVPMKQIFDNAALDPITATKIGFNEYLWTPFVTPDPAKSYEFEVSLSGTTYKVALTVPES